MKVISDPTLVTHELCIKHEVLGLAIELFNIPGREVFEMGEIVKIRCETGFISAEVFCPGGRFVLKRFEYHNTISLKPLSRLQKIIRFLFDMVDINVNKHAILSEVDVTLRIINILDGAGDDLVRKIKTGL